MYIGTRNSNIESFFNNLGSWLHRNKKKTVKFEHLSIYESWFDIWIRHSSTRLLIRPITVSEQIFFSLIQGILNSKVGLFDNISLGKKCSFEILWPRAIEFPPKWKMELRFLRIAVFLWIQLKSIITYITVWIERDNSPCRTWSRGAAPWGCRRAATPRRESSWGS